MGSRGNMGNSSSVKYNLSPEELRAISDETGFTLGQISRLYDRFDCLDEGGKGYLAREDVINIPELRINPLSDRIVHAMFTDNPAVHDLDKLLFQDFVRVLSHFRPISKNEQKVKLNSKRDKLKFSFRMYDLDGDGQISKDELFTVLEQMVEGIDPEELRRISERFITEIDISDVSSETNHIKLIIFFDKI